LIKQSLRGLTRRANDSRKLDHATLEVLQMRGAASRGGASGGAGGRAGVTRGTVFGWLAKYREGGPQGAAGRAGAGQAAEAERRPAAPPAQVDRGG
jgi:hypothetical protein